MLDFAQDASLMMIIGDAASYKSLLAQPNGWLTQNIWGKGSLS